MCKHGCSVQAHAILCRFLLNLVRGTPTLLVAFLILVVATDSLEHEILLQVNLEKSSHHDMLSDSSIGTLSAAVDPDGSFFPLFLDEHGSDVNSHTSLARAKPISNASLKITPNSTTEYKPEPDWANDWLQLSRHEFTQVLYGALIILGGLFIIIGNCLLQQHRDDDVQVDKTRCTDECDAWEASFSGKSQVKIAEEVRGTPRTEHEKRILSRHITESLSPDYSVSFRILGQNVVRDEILCDYVFVMPLAGTSHSNFHWSGGARFMRLNWQEQVDGLTLAKEVFRSPNKVHLYTAQHLEERFSNTMTGEMYQEAVRKLLAETFTDRSFGLMVGCDPSADHDEIFVKLSVPRHNNTIGQYAANMSYHMPLNDDAYERIGKKVKMDADKNYTRAFTVFDPEHRDSFKSFREIDIVRLLRARMDKHLNLTALCNQGVVAEHFSPHNYSEVQSMCETWANAWTWYRIPTHDNDDKIRNYFGEEVAWMFVWNVHYVRWLCVPATIGGIMYFRMFLPIVLQHEILVGYAILMALWCTLFNSFYDRRETRIQHRWGMHDHIALATLFARNDYVPALKDSWQVVFFPIFGDILGLLTVGLSVGGMIAIDRYVTESYFGHAFLITAQILIIDVWWRTVSMFIVQKENHEHQDRWLRSWTRKMFCVRIFNNLYPFLYVGFFKETHAANGCKPFNSCLDELSWDLLSYFAARILKEVAANMWRLGIVRMQLIHESWNAINTPREGLSHTYLELQAKALPYNDVVKMNDWIEQVLTFAFVACFSVVLPAISFIALLTSLLRTRLVAHRNALYLRRPPPWGSRGIEAWREMLVLTEVIAVVINLGFAIFVMKPLVDLSTEKKCVIFFIAEHLIFAVKVMCKTKFPTTPSDVERLHRSCQRVVRRSFVDLKRHPIDAEVVQLVEDVPSIGPNAFGGRNSTMRRSPTSRERSRSHSYTESDDGDGDGSPRKSSDGDT